MGEVSTLSVENLWVDFRNGHSTYSALRNVNFQIRKGEIMGLVGESGCGKSLTSLAVMRLLPHNAIIKSGRIQVNDFQVVDATEGEMNGARGNIMSMIFQEPMVALNPLATVGNQIEESLILHMKLDAKRRRQRVLELLGSVGIPNPIERVNQYPFELSGGMRQRVMIAIALACEPSLIIADEPTTALDVTVQAQILDLFKDIRARTGSSILFITHDMGVIADIADRVSVMYAGSVVESADVIEIYKNPCHPYTRGLLSSIPTLDSPRDEELSSIPGVVPDLKSMPTGCPFQARCPVVTDICRQRTPPMTQVSAGHSVACWQYEGGSA